VGVRDLLKGKWGLRRKGEPEGGKGTGFGAHHKKGTEMRGRELGVKKKNPLVTVGR